MKQAFVAALRLAGVFLDQESKRDAVGKEEKNEHQAFVTNLGQHSGSVRARISK